MYPKLKPRALKTPRAHYLYANVSDDDITDWHNSHDDDTALGLQDDALFFRLRPARGYIIRFAHPAEMPDGSAQGLVASCYIPGSKTVCRYFIKVPPAQFPSAARLARLAASEMWSRDCYERWPTIWPSVKDTPFWIGSVRLPKTRR